MSRLIDAETVKEQVKLYFNKFARDGLKTEIIERATNDIAEVIDNVPTVDAERHGHWTPVNPDMYGAEYFECSVCGMYSRDGLFRKELGYEYCPNCGAKMDEVEE